MNTSSFDEKTIQAIKEKSIQFQALTQEVSEIIVGNEDTISFIEIALLCNGHILLEGVPGIAKTTMIKAIHKALGLSFSRIQFTPDLLPADLIGTLVYNQKTQSFDTKKGPIFANLILADEINRAPAKVQSALLESMQEHQVTIGATTYPLDEPFLVFATQNPIEQEGTYRLPEAQVDRFMFKLLLSYPDKKNEREILRRNTDINRLKQVINKKDLFSAQHLVSSLYIDEKIDDYLVNIIQATRHPLEYQLKDLASLIQYGASPRATLALHHASKAHAFLQQRHFVIPDDIKIVAPAILRHRLLLTYEAEAEYITPDSVIQKILSTIPSP